MGEKHERYKQGALKRVVSACILGFNNQFGILLK